MHRFHYGSYSDTHLIDCSHCKIHEYIKIYFDLFYITIVHILQQRRKQTSVYIHSQHIVLKISPRRTWKCE